MPSQCFAIVMSQDTLSRHLPPAEKLPFSVDNRFYVDAKIGGGVTSVVYKATQRSSGEIVAVKHVAGFFPSIHDAMHLREINARYFDDEELVKSIHPNIVKLLEVNKSREGKLFLIFECAEKTLMNVISGPLNELMANSDAKSLPQMISEPFIKSTTFQILQGLKFLHGRNVIHRDIKPENILLFGDMVKICDLGIARSTNERYGDMPFTDYVLTRWYRAPELLIPGNSFYTESVDIWAVGCIAAELFRLTPLFSAHFDYKRQIVSALGFPNSANWPQFGYLFEFDENGRVAIEIPAIEEFSPLEARVPFISSEGIDFLSNIFLYDETLRMTAEECLIHSWFTA